MPVAAVGGSATRTVAALPVWAFCVMVCLAVLPLLYGIIMSAQLTLKRRASVKLFHPPSNARGLKGWWLGADGTSAALTPYSVST